LTQRRRNIEKEQIKMTRKQQDEAEKQAKA